MNIEGSMKRCFVFALLICFRFTLPVMAQPATCADIEDFVPKLDFDTDYYLDQVDSYNLQITDNNDNAELYTFRGDAYYALQDYTNAIVDFKQAIILNADNTYAYARLGDTYQQIFDLQAALEN